jgi:DNA-binding NtrC family response regulator
MSGYASTVEAEDEAWMEFLQKPFSPEQLRDRLEEVLS